MFIEFTDPDTGVLVMVNTAHILSVHSVADAEYTIVKVIHSGGVQSLSCAESYEHISKLIKG